jgi:16S rRNA (adenine1518-N6/adenine1519-N6)-dimethyltransferase
VRARKALGQHFLNDSALLARIAEASGASPGDVVLEIGPGPGGLTSALLDRGATVVAIERDPRMASALFRKLDHRPFVLIEGDALELDWSQLVAPWTSQGATWRVVGNIPYYITSPLLDQALTAPLPSSVTFLVQEEVARRLVAPPGSDDYGALTVGISAVAECRIAMRVGRGAFAPPPKVDSAVVHLVPRADPLVTQEEIPALRRLVVSLFSYRRKRMHRALREAQELTAEQATTALDRAGIDADVRPEVLAPEAFVRLLGALKS